jgi:RimJ/RimL family protein N-acetyltransferase
MKIITNNYNLQLRKVSLDDCKTVFIWINDPIVRVMSTKMHIVTIDEHKKWFYSALKNEFLYYFIIMDGDTSIGQIKFEKKGDHAVVSVLLIKSYRRKSLSSEIIKKSSEYIFSITEINKLKACIKIENQYSLKAFTKADI